MLNFAFSDTCIQCPQTCSNAPLRAETPHLKHLGFFKTYTAFSKLYFLSFTFHGDRPYGARQHWEAQHGNPGIWAVALVPHPHNTTILLHRPGHLPINPRSASFNQVNLQEGSMLAEKPLTCATTQHRKTFCIQQKWNLTRECQSNTTERQTKG